MQSFQKIQLQIFHASEIYITNQINNKNRSDWEWYICISRKKYTFVATDQNIRQKQSLKKIV